MNKFIIIDGNSLINRAFYALPLLSNAKGEYSNAVYGFCNIIVKLIKEQSPTHMAVAFDVGKPTFRHYLYKEYKGTRKKMPEELATQIPILKTILKSMDIHIIEKEGIEADDIIGTLSKIDNCEKIIVSGDRDVLQLIDKDTKVWFTKKGISNIIIYDEKQLKEDFNIEPFQVVEIKALMGDSGDNIPGVSGVGEKTAYDLIEKYQTLDNVYNNIENISGALKEKLIKGKEIAYLSKKLATISQYEPLNKKLEMFTYIYPFKKQTYDLFIQYDFKSLLKRDDIFDNIDEIVSKSTVSSKINKISNITQLEKLVEEIRKYKEFAFCIDKDIHISISKFEECIVQVKQTMFDDGIDFDKIFEYLKDVLCAKDIKKIVFDNKLLKHALKEYGCILDGEIFDIVIAQYLVFSGKRVDKSVDEFLFNSGYAQNSHASAMFNGKATLLNSLEEASMLQLYNDVEMPLSKVLFDMENNGVKLDITELQIQKNKFENDIEEISAQIYDLAGVKFNISSPKQLGNILYDKLLLLKDNKKRSTDISVLDSIENNHPIVPLIKKYRDYTKILTTYIYGFLEKVNNKTQLLHTVFNQTLTTTGRLSSSEPNLQNIPMRKDEGKQIRKIFISRFNNGKLVSADYSQIELRLLAHFSQDEQLIKAFKNGEDIHSQTASKIFNVPLDKVTPDLRRKAKAVNFGIIYGISEYGLSQNINSTQKYAKDAIEKYFASYPRVKDYMNSSIEKAKKIGYVSTLLGRRRKIDEISSSNYNTRLFGERAAMNMPLQGTASDIIKLAMVKVSDEFEKNKLKSKLILQIHDELIVDCENSEVKLVEQILKNCMENVVKLSVPITVDIDKGDNWLEAK